MNEPSAPRETSTNPAVLRILTLDRLQELVDRPMVARFILDGQAVEVPVHRLKPAQQELVDRIYDFSEGRSRELRPPKVPGRDDYDTADPKYLERLAELRRCARAMAIYLGCEAVRVGRPDLADRDQIRTYVDGILTEQILDLLHLTIMSSGLNVAEAANFTSPPVSGI